jgi:hypothetical protein
MNPNNRPHRPANTNPARPARPSRLQKKTPPAGNGSERTQIDEHEGATDEQVGDTTGPGVGYDQEPEQERDKGGVIGS